ncbi:MAG: serine hydrolase [Chitinophagales bacterium]
MRNYINKLIVVCIFAMGWISQSCHSDDVSLCPRDGDDGGAGGNTSEYVYCESAVIGSNPIGIAGGTFNTNVFLNMMDSLLNGIVGYQVAVGWNEQIVGLRSVGNARNENDCILRFNECNRMNGASIAKNLTAAATLKLLEANNLTVDDLVAPYLPDSWEPSDYAKTLSFRHFLAHRTALPSVNSDFDNTLSYDGLKTFIESEPVDTQVINPANPDENMYVYKNANFATMRVVIPQLWKNTGVQIVDLQQATEITDYLSQRYFDEYITKELLNPSGVFDATLNMPSGAQEATLYYDASNLDSEGTPYTLDWRYISGGGGWWISARDLVKYMQTIQNNDAVLSSGNRALMYGHPTLNWRFGFNRAIATTRGTGQGHGGQIGDRLRAILCHLPENISICVMTNSTHPAISDYDNSTLQSMIISSYDAAWE